MRCPEWHPLPGIRWSWCGGRSLGVVAGGPEKGRELETEGAGGVGGEVGVEGMPSLGEAMLADAVVDRAALGRAVVAMGVAVGALHAASDRAKATVSIQSGLRFMVRLSLRNVPSWSTVVAWTERVCSKQRGISTGCCR